jgi:LacI family transcriptional regulator
MGLRSAPGEGGAVDGLGRRVTRDDVARRAGVSPAVVSLVLNGRPHVRPETRRRVEEAIAELGYAPNLAARSLKTRQTGLFAYMAGDIGNPFFPDLALSMERAARRHGYALILCQPGEEAFRALLQRPVDGILVGSVTEAQIQAARDRGIALVGLYRDLTAPGLPWVDTRWEEGMRLVFDHLVGLGHRRLALLDGGVEEARSRAYRAECLARGLEGADRRASGAWRADGGYRAMQQLLRAGGFTAVVAANDLMALGAVRACREAGVRVPEDVSVVGYDDLGLARLSVPALTTVRYPRRAAGAVAVRLLLEAREGRAPRGVLLPARLVVRESTGPAR